MSRTLTARMEEGRDLVDLRLEVPEIGAVARQIPVAQFANSIQEWLAGNDDEATRANTGMDRVLGLLRTPDKWQISALGSTLRYALLIEGDWRIAIANRPVATQMELKYDDDDEDDDSGENYNTYSFLVPPRTIVGVWKGDKLQSGLMFLVESASQLPIASNDTLHPVTPWVWGNVNGYGQICFGTTTRPTWGADGVTGIEQVFFGSVFNADIGAFWIRDRDGERTDDAWTLGAYHRDQVALDSETVTLPVGNRPKLLLSCLEYAIQHPW